MPKQISMSEHMCQLVWSGKALPLDASEPAAVFQGAAKLNLLNRMFELHQYRGFTVITAEDQYDEDYSAMAKQGLFSTFAAFAVHRSPNGGADTEFLTTDCRDRETALLAFRQHVDAYLSRPAASP